MSAILFESLTEAQRDAVTHLDGPLLILAGPGSGKTRVITHRIANLLVHGIPARQILALTFTNKAADEMKRRVQSLAPDQPVWMSTFHRFCGRILRQYAAQVGLAENYTIYDTSDQRSTLKRVLDLLHIDSTHFTPDAIANRISWAKNNLVSTEQYLEHRHGALDAVVARAYPAYQQALIAANAVDFDDLLYHVAVLLREAPEIRSALDDRYRYLMVDEYQDTNFAQYAIVRALSINYPNLAVTGDPDQSIYGWRGANLSNILDFEHDFPQVKIVKLEQNYRSSKAILNVADALIAHNTQRKPKRLFTENGQGDLVSLVHYPTQQDEAESIAVRIATDLHTGKRSPRDFAVFYRVNALSRALEFALREHGIPYQMVNGLEFYQRKEIKDVIGYLRLINNPRDNAAFERIINNPPRKIGKTTVDRLREHAVSKGKSMLDTAHESGLVEGLTKRAAVQVARFVHLYEKLSLLASAPVEEVIGHVLIESGYREHLQNSADEFDEDRLANIEELLTAARQFDELHPVRSNGNGPTPLEEFLEQASLVADTDAWDSDSDRVTLMTLHAAKGLEFPAVFIVALEEGLLPHERSRGELRELEEERRLLFVGITRAQEELHLSLASNRDYRGTRRLTVPSQFLMELPREAMQVVQPRWTASFEPQEFRSADDESCHDVFDELAEYFSSPDEEADVPSRGDHRSEAQGSAVASTRDLAGLQTAAELHAESKLAAASRFPVEAFELGMIVKHGQHGLGRIIALAGSGSRRQATVKFVAAGEHKFMLAHSDLRPAVS